jgi:hypothetical protein
MEKFSPCKGEGERTKKWKNFLLLKERGIAINHYQLPNFTAAPV